MFTNFLKVSGIISPLIRHFRFSIFVLETLKLEWQCSQYLELNPTCLGEEESKYGDLFWDILQSFRQ